MRQLIHFLSSDAWLLQAIGLAGQSTPASLQQIIAAGDFINHAIFTWEEIRIGLHRLIAGKLIEAEGKRFQLSQSFVAEYVRLIKHTQVIFRQGQALLVYLQNSSLPEMEDSVFLPVTQEDFEAAVTEYQQSIFTA